MTTLMAGVLFIAFVFHGFLLIDIIFPDKDSEDEDNEK